MPICLKRWVAGSHVAAVIAQQESTVAASMQGMDMERRSAWGAAFASRGRWLTMALVEPDLVKG